MRREVMNIVRVIEEHITIITKNYEDVVSKLDFTTDIKEKFELEKEMERLEDELIGLTEQRETLKLIA